MCEYSKPQYYGLLPEVVEVSRSLKRITFNLGRKQFNKTPNLIILFWKMFTYKIQLALLFTIPVIYFSIRSRCFSGMTGRRWSVVKIKWVYRLLHAIFILIENKVIRLYANLIFFLLRLPIYHNIPGDMYRKINIFLSTSK